MHIVVASVVVLYVAVPVLPRLRACFQNTFTFTFLQEMTPRRSAAVAEDGVGAREQSKAERRAKREAKAKKKEAKAARARKKAEEAGGGSAIKGVNVDEDVSKALKRIVV